MSTRFLRLCVVVPVLALLAGPALHAAETPSSKPEMEKSTPASAVHQAWEWLTGFWAAIGCSLDPSGACAPKAGTTDPVDDSSALDLGEIGCSLDPDGCPK